MSEHQAAARRRIGTVVALGSAQTLAWASSYYLPAVLASSMARDLGVSIPTVFAAFSLALAISALPGPWIGRVIDRWGGRPVLVGTNVVFALGLFALAHAYTPLSLFAAWSIIGLAMGCGLYETAFSTLVRLYGHDSRDAITGITLIAGLASTVGWPLSAYVEVTFGWRGACSTWAVLHLLLGLPLNAMLPRAPGRGMHAHSLRNRDAFETNTIKVVAPTSLTLGLLAFVFATTWFIATAMAAHLPALLQMMGSSLTASVAIGALVGPAQVAGRLFEFGVLRRVHPLLSARLASLLHPLGVVALLLAGPVMAPFFAVLHGAGNGILTIAKGTLPLVLFGAHGYGTRQGWLTMPARAAQALAPFAFGMALARWGSGSLWLSAALGLVVFGALLVLRQSEHQ